MHVFVSYRHGERVEDLISFLGSSLGRGRVHWDQGRAAAALLGSFRAQVHRWVRRSDVVLVLVGQVWIARAARLAAANDPVRHEMESARERGKCIVLVLLDV